MVTTHNKFLLLVCGSVLLLAGCYKNKTVYLDAPQITRTVTFSKDILPIFSKSCSLSGCHSSGAQAPNLTDANAYNSLIIGNYINKSVPESSLIYLKMTGKKGTAMPPAGSNKDYNALILAWIQQGANNN
ncbi:MAG: hypothetical protein ACM3VS_00935 [Candidatus Dadabacteria bacterium]